MAATDNYSNDVGTISARYSIGLLTALLNNAGALSVVDKTDTLIPLGVGDATTSSQAATLGQLNASVAKPISFNVATAPLTTSSNAFPAGSVITSTWVQIATAYSVSTGLEIGVSGTTNKFATLTTTQTAVPGIYKFDQLTAQATSVAPIATITGSPSVGAAKIWTFYGVPLTGQS
jgi:hypothetical protein